ncbi:hypothetical protein CBER1_08769 [Cercospora berteroae]|uniref:Uncharacterized protein n=1 Tax=Cercospora berteroae TaxID=357750 RepID=A0A2S6BW04_9PEZI|nr:hypothetical protein CBER1_08769 [Cercospora berteroae]
MLSDQCPICRSKICQGPPDPKAAINAILDRFRDSAAQLRQNLDEEARTQHQRRDAFREAVHRILDAEAPNGEVWRIGALVRRLRNDPSAGRYEFEYDEAYEMLGVMHSERTGIVVISDLVLRSDHAEGDAEEAEVEDLDESAEGISDDGSEKESENSDMDAAEDSGEESEAGDEACPELDDANSHKDPRPRKPGLPLPASWFFFCLGDEATLQWAPLDIVKTSGTFSSSADLAGPLPYSDYVIGSPDVVGLRGNHALGQASARGRFHKLGFETLSAQLGIRRNEDGY